MSRVHKTEKTTPTSAPRRIFLLSPADSSGVRARMMVSERAQFELARRLRQAGLPLGEIFSFISGLYFRGKLAYARTFAQSSPGVPGAFVITACRGLVPPETPITLQELQEISAVPIEPSDARYRVPLSAMPAHYCEPLRRTPRWCCWGASRRKNTLSRCSEFLAIGSCFPQNSLAAGT